MRAKVGFLTGWGLLHFKMSPGTPGFCLLPLWKFIGTGAHASVRQSVTLLKYKEVKKFSHVLTSQKFLVSSGPSPRIQTLSGIYQRPVSSGHNSNHMIIVHWGGQTPLSLPPFCSLLETLEMRPDIALTNVLQGMCLHWALGNDLEGLIGLFHL